MSEVSVPEYAKMRGVTHKAVYKAIEAGRISVKENNKIDPKLADKEWSENSDMAKVENQGQAHKRGSTKAEGDAIIANIKARLLDIQLKEKLGKLIPVEDVERQAFEAGRRVREALLKVPHNICNEIVHVKDPKKAEDIIRNAIKESMRNAAK